MKRSELALLALVLVGISVITYYVHYLIFRDPHHIFIFLVGDIAFVFLEVFLVGMVLERILARREKKAMLGKLNMVAGAFFSEVGNKLLSMLVKCYPHNSQICPCLDVTREWEQEDYKRALNYIGKLQAAPHCGDVDLDRLKDFLLERRSFILRLLENPHVLEHEHGSNLLWAVLHLTEELEARSSLGNLPESDLEYLGQSIHRVYCLAAAEWITYMQYLKTNQPFLFTLILRVHPFREQSSPIVDSPAST
ncbi:MAG: hypothetical protein WCS74_04085 [Dehalococcoidales bacterium]